MTGRTLAAALLASLLLGAAAPAPRVLDAAASYPEGPLVTPRGVLVAEMGRDQVTLYAGGGATRPFFADPGCGPTATAPYADGYLVLCHRRGGVALISAEGALRARIDRLGNPNDASADTDGAVYLSSPGPFTKQSRPQGVLLRIAPDGAVRAVAQGLWYPNGVHVDRARRRLFVSEHLARRVLVFDIGANGDLVGQRVFAEIDAIAPPAAAPLYEEAGPDGLELAPNGDLVVAIYGEGRFLQIRPDGRLRRVIRAPGRYVTNIAFEPSGAAVITAPKDNTAPPFPGVVARLPSSTFAAD